MAITFTNDRWFKTDAGSRIFQNVPVAGQWFKLLVTSKTAVTTASGGVPFLFKSVVNFTDRFNGLGTSTTYRVRFTTTSFSGTNTQLDIDLTLGVVYGIAFTWDGTGAGQQGIWISGIPNTFNPSFSGNTQNSSQALQFGLTDNTCKIVYALDDHNIWNNYLLTSTDIANLLNGADPTTIGTSATWRGRWTLAGTTGASPSASTAPGATDVGLRNAFGGGGSLTSGGDGSDCISMGGSGTAVYAPSLVWAPTVANSPVYVDTSGKAVAVFFQSKVNGQQVVPSQVLADPTMRINGGAPVTLGSPWFTGYHPFVWYPFPAGVQVAPTDIVALSAPPAWANTPAGSVEGMEYLVIANRTGKSVVRDDSFVPMIPMGMNMYNCMIIWAPQYFFKNWKMRTYGGRDKYSSAGQWGIYNTTGGNGIDSTEYPGAPGLWLVMWDTSLPSNVNQFAITSTSPLVSITERTDLKASPVSGTGMCRVFDVEHVSLTGSAAMAINLTLSGTINYDNLWIVGPGDFDIVAGAVVLDRTDPWALSNVCLGRIPQNVGSMRWHDATTSGNPFSLPYPENLRGLDWESWGDLAFFEVRFGYTALGPVDTIATPWIYSQHLGKPGAAGQTFTATLTTPITTTPAANTQETWVFSDGAAAPLMAGLEIKIDNEFVRLISQGVDANHWVVNRGSNGTTPATHAAGTVTVYGRTPITTVLQSDGSTHDEIVWQLTTQNPHGQMTGTRMSCDGSGWPTLTFGNTQTLNFQGLVNTPFVTGPNTFFAQSNAIGGHPTGGILPSVTSLTPANQYWDRRWPLASSMPHEASAIVTGKFPQANLHVNIWPDACDDMVAETARRVMANFPAGRKIYIEYNNEPWNSAFNGYDFHGKCMGPLVVPGNPYWLAHYAFRAFQVHRIFRNVFAAAGRGGEIVGILNCQMGGAEAQQHLNYAISTSNAVDAIAIAPYVFTEPTALNAGVFNRIDDEQAISMFVHDVWYNPGYPNGSVATDKDYINAYNASTSHNCILMGYEGGVEQVYPRVSSGVTLPAERNHDCVTNPNFYVAEQDFYAWVQNQGFDHLHVYALAMPWGALNAAWGMYHSILQDHGRGDGTDGKLNNLVCRANPTSPNYKGSNVNQDMNTVSVRGQAFDDWLASIAAPPPTTGSPRSGIATLGFGSDITRIAMLGFGGTPTTATLSGPSTGTAGSSSTSFTITLDVAAPPGGVVCTVQSSNAGDAITPTPIVIAAGATTGTFTITPVSPGARSISLFSTTPTLTFAGSPITYTATPVDTTAATLSGPITGANGIATDPYTITLNSPAITLVTCTITSSVGGDTIAPNPVVIPIGGTSRTFKVTPHSTGSRTITLATSPVLTIHGSPITLVVSAPLPPETFTGSPIVVLNPAAMWRPGGWR